MPTRTEWQPGEPLYPDAAYGTDCFHRHLFSVVNDHHWCDSCPICDLDEVSISGGMRWTPEVLMYEYPSCPNCFGGHSPLDGDHCIFSPPEIIPF